jgi:hypothetical protein
MARSRRVKSCYRVTVQPTRVLLNAARSLANFG